MAALGDRVHLLQRILDGHSRAAAHLLEIAEDALHNHLRILIGTGRQHDQILIGAVARQDVSGAERVNDDAEDLLHRPLDHFSVLIGCLHAVARRVQRKERQIDRHAHAGHSSGFELIDLFEDAVLAQVRALDIGGFPELLLDDGEIRLLPVLPLHHRREQLLQLVRRADAEIVVENLLGRAVMLLRVLLPVLRDVGADERRVQLLVKRFDIERRERDVLHLLVLPDVLKEVRQIPGEAEVSALVKRRLRHDPVLALQRVQELPAVERKCLLIMPDLRSRILRALALLDLACEFFGIKRHRELDVPAVAAPACGDKIDIRPGLFQNRPEAVRQVFQGADGIGALVVLPKGRRQLLRRTAPLVIICQVAEELHDHVRANILLADRLYAVAQFKRGEQPHPHEGITHLFRVCHEISSLPFGFFLSGGQRNIRKCRRKMLLFALTQKYTYT